MKIALGSDHGGYALKCDIIQLLEKLGHEYKDFGCYSTESCDYPDFGEAAARAVASGEYDRGIVICTTGIGISIAANKVQGIRCAHCADSLEAEMTRRHNDANMLAIGAGFTGKNLAERMVEVFLSTDFEGGRHERRVNKLNAIQPLRAGAISWRRGDGHGRHQGLPELPGQDLQGEDRAGSAAGAHHPGGGGLSMAAGVYRLR